MRNVLLAVLALILILAIGLATAGLHAPFIDVIRADACRDRGGAWDAATKSCRGGAGKGAPRDGRAGGSERKGR